tara:strand:+ start:103 stop:372 length:270 start_codon:yes stop_codon:yes gene_type:complete
MAKKVHNMTTDERIAYFEREREKEKSARAVKINKLSYQQRVAVIEVHKLLDNILDTALYPDMGGIKMVSAYELQELSDAKDRLAFEFNL